VGAEAQLAALLCALPLDEQAALGSFPFPIQAAALAAGVTAPGLVPALAELLERVPSYDFDAFALGSAAQGAPLSALFTYLLAKLGLLDTFQVDLRTMARFTRALEARMPHNGYHNGEHIADVVQSVALLLTGALQDLADLSDDPLTVLALLLAAAIHDFEHPGLTGDHLVAMSHPWALQYNDRAVLEQHHLSASFALLHSPGLDWTDGLSVAQQTRLRGTVIALVLGTDMKEHFTLLENFDTMLHRVRISGASRRRSRLSCVGLAACSDVPEGTPATVAALSEPETLLLLKIALKVADLGHLRAQGDIHQRWVGGLCHEFYNQGDIERALGMPVNNLMCRQRAAELPSALAASQVGFFDVIALPLISRWARATGARHWLERVNRNYEFWKAERDNASAVDRQEFVPFSTAIERIAGLPHELHMPDHELNDCGSGSVRWRRDSGGIPARRRESAAEGVLEELETMLMARSSTVGTLPSDSSGESEVDEEAAQEAHTRPPVTDARGRACDWCGLRPRARGGPRPSRAARAAAAAAAAATFAEVLSALEPSAAVWAPGEPVCWRARFSHSDAAAGVRACRLRYADFRRLLRISTSGVPAACLEEEALGHSSGEVNPNRHSPTRRPRRRSCETPGAAHPGLARHRVGHAYAQALTQAQLEDSVGDGGDMPGSSRSSVSWGEMDEERFGALHVNGTCEQ